MRVEFPRWFEPFRAPATYKCAYGGRSASKTRTLAMWLVLQAYQRRIRCACVREFQKNLDDSVKRVLEDTIYRFGLSEAFDIQVNRIVCRETGSVFFFQGIARHPESVKGWESVTHVWVEEAERLSHDSADILIPTVTRGAIEEIWFTWNPNKRTDWVWQRFVVHPRPKDVIRKVTYKDNPWFPETANDERLGVRAENPAKYRWIWHGEPNDGNADTTVLPFSILEPCIDAWREGLHNKADAPVRDIGLDIADAGEDVNAIVDREGPTLRHIDSWPTHEAGVLEPTAKRAHARAEEVNAWRLYYDAGGVGSAIRGDFRRLSPALSYGLKPENFGGEVKGKKRDFTRDRTNEKVFTRRNIQLAWAVRLRALNTIKLRRGKDVDPNRCLFIPGDLPGIDAFLADLTQPQWRDNPTTGKIELDKRGDNPDKSPDLFDALCLAFARDSQDGLTERG